MQKPYPRLGAWLWVASLQYYLVQIIVASAWRGTSSFSWLQNTISDLGNTACAPYGERYVCSPLHPLMNLSFLTLGATMIVGSLLLLRLAANHWGRLGFYCLIAAGLGTILVGLFPENSISIMHVLGAALPFVLGNLGIILVTTGLPQLPTWLRWGSYLVAVAALLALPLFLTGTTLGIGGGGMERIVAYPQSIWMIIVGTYLLCYNKR